MELELTDLNETALRAAAEFYEERGYLRVAGASDIADRFRPILAERISPGEPAGRSFLDTENTTIFPAEVRQRLSRVETPRELAVALTHRLQPLLDRLIGPFVHVSSSFHAQFKAPSPLDVDHGGYAPDAKYLEVHGSYLLHQDFTGASLPTSPSALTLWVAMNTCPDWSLRVYPGSHRQGLLGHRWLKLDDPRLAALDDPVDIFAREGTAVLFNALLLHGTGVPGSLRRVSCDIRFFPLCGFLPSEVHVLGDSPLEALGRGLERAPGPTTRAPLLEDRVFLGGAARLPDAPPHSVLNWVNYLSSIASGDPERALVHLGRFVNEDLGIDGVSVYAAKFHGRPFEETTLRGVRSRLERLAPGAPELDELDRLIQRISRAGVAS